MLSHALSRSLSLFLLLAARLLSQWPIKFEWNWNTVPTNVTLVLRAARCRAARVQLH